MYEESIEVWISYISLDTILTSMTYLRLSYDRYFQLVRMVWYSPLVGYKIILPTKLRYEVIQPSLTVRPCLFSSMFPNDIYLGNAMSLLITHSPSKIKCILTNWGKYNQGLWLHFPDYDVIWLLWPNDGIVSSCSMLQRPCAKGLLTWLCIVIWI